MKIFSARYSNKNIPASGLAPIRITVGHPRFKLAYELAGTLSALAPSRAWFHSSPEVFTERYREQLDQVGLDVIRGELERLSEANAGRDLALLCFENLGTGDPSIFCHRRLFADFWQEQTGEMVEELAEPTTPARTAPQQPQLL